MNNTRISIGDKVTVVFPNGEMLMGRVNYMAQGSGDCWIIEAETSVHHIQHFQEIFKLKGVQ